MTASSAAIAGAARAFTVATSSLAESRRFYERGWQLRAEGPLVVPDDVRAAQRTLWRVPDDFEWQTWHLHRDGVDYAATLRLLVLEHATPAFREDWDPATLGPYTIGFPNARQEAFDRELRALGFGARNALERTWSEATPGRRYEILETVFTGPDSVAGVGVARGAGEPGITPLDARGFGGPGYSMMIVEDVEPMLRFMIEGLGYRLRQRKIWKSSGRQGALNLPDGTEFDFAQAAPLEDPHGFLVFIAYRNLSARPPAHPPRLPHRGLVLYTLPVRGLDAVLERVRALPDCGPLIGPLALSVPGIGGRRWASVEAPNGVVFELYE